MKHAFHKKDLSLQQSRLVAYHMRPALREQKICVLVNPLATYRSYNRKSGVDTRDLYQSVTDARINFQLITTTRQSLGDTRFCILVRIH